MNVRLDLLADYYVGGFLHVALKLPTVLLGKLLHRDHDLHRCSSVTVIKMLGGGSLAVAYPALLAIRRAPQVRQMRLVTTSEIRPFAQVIGIFDEILVIRSGSLFTMIADSLAATWKLFRCEVLLDLEVHSRLTTVFSLITCARNRVGFYTTISAWRKNLATHLLFFNMSNPVYYFYDQLAILFGVEAAGFEDCVQVFSNSLAPVRRTPEAGVLRLSLAPCCSELSKERRLRPEEWLVVLDRKLAGLPADTRTEIHLIGGPGDCRDLDQLAALIQARLPATLTVNHAGKASLRESILEVAASDELLCIDSGLLHIARLLHVPTTSFWGPTDPHMLLRPTATSRDVVHYQKLSCSPCVHMSDRLPCGGNNVCMRLTLESSHEDTRNVLWVISANGSSGLQAGGGLAAFTES